MSTAEAVRHSQVGPVIVMGVSGSGKSLIGGAIAARFGVPLIERDRPHPDTNVAKMPSGVPLTDDDRWPWLDRVGEYLRATAAVGGAPWRHARH